LSSVSRRSSGRASAEIWEPEVESAYTHIFPARAAPTAFAGATAARYAWPACCFVIVAAGAVRDATVVVCKMFFARAAWAGFLGDPPQPMTAREKALAPIPIARLTRFIAVSFRTDDDIRRQ
jgi:hypothetical protein